MDPAKLLAEKHKDSRIIAELHHAVAEKFREEGKIKDVLMNYKICLSHHAFYRLVYQNCIAMLFNSKSWQEAENFAKDGINLVGELPSICFAYGRALLKNKKYSLALKYLKKSDQKISDMIGILQNVLRIQMIKTWKHLTQTSLINESPSQ